MKKVLALVLAAVMALSLATAVSAAIVLTPDDTTPATSGDANMEVTFGADAQEILLMGDGTEFVILTAEDAVGTEGEDFACKDIETGKDISLSASVTSTNPSVLAATLKTEDGYKASADVADADGKVIIKKGAVLSKNYTLVLKPAKEFFTVEDQKVTVKVVIVQKQAGNDQVKATVEIKDILVSNKVHDKNDFVENADGKKVTSAIGDLSNPVIAANVFTDAAKDKALELEYADYSVNFAKVSAQNTALYLKAATGVVAAPTKAIASIAFQPTRVKDAASITMPISADNENLYGEKVYVYALVDGKPSGDAIEGTVVNHNSVIFSVPAGTALGTWAAYGDKALGDAEKPAIPETGANDIVNIAIVFAVVALAAAGFVAVKKASK